MAAVEEFVYAWLAGQADIADLVKDNEVVDEQELQIWPNTSVDVSKFPRIVYSKLGDRRPQSLNGRGSVCRAEIQIDCYGRGDTAYSQCKQLSQLICGDDTVGDRLDGYRGGDYAGVFVQAALLQDRRDFDESPEPGSDRPIHRTSLVFAISYEE